MKIKRRKSNNHSLKERENLYFLNKLKEYRSFLLLKKFLKMNKAVEML